MIFFRQRQIEDMHCNGGFILRQWLYVQLYFILLATLHCIAGSHYNVMIHCIQCELIFDPNTNLLEWTMTVVKKNEIGNSFG